MMKSSSEWATYRRLLGYAKPYAGRLAVGVIFGTIFGGSMAGFLIGLQKTLGTFFSSAEITLEATILVALLLPLFALIRGVGDYISTYCMEWVGNRVVMDLRNAVFTHLQDLSLQYFTKSRTGELISRTVNDTSQIERSVSTFLADLAKQPPAVVATAGFMVWLDLKLAVLTLVVFPICIVPVALFGRKVRRFSRQGQEKLADVMSILQETITGARIVKAFGMEQYEIGRFRDQCRAVFNRVMRMTRAKAAVEPIIIFISMVGLALILLYARYERMTFDHFFAFAAAMVALYDPVKKLSKIHISIQQSSAAADRVFEVLDTPITVAERAGARNFDEPVRTVCFERVSFAYDSEPVLRDIDLTVNAGECIALVGSSGSGKSTMVSLLPRFFDVTSGRILINGVDIRELTIKSLRKMVGIVTQDTFLFNDTVASNIAYGHTEASREHVEAAAKKALAHDFIMQMPEGYETVIGERGVRLSGGQCQRLSIARAILRNPPILILDEATSALDTESERQVQAALNELMAGRTVFAIAHRLSTVTHADRILVLDQGRIAEQGTHHALLEQGGLYKYYYGLQFKETAPVQ
jgi:subfamily B ATP-binding cassette protein MsbA